MSNEAAVRLVLDKFIKDIFGGFYEDWEDAANTCSSFDADNIKRAVELGFVAGQKQEQNRCEKEIGKEAETAFGDYGIAVRLFGERVKKRLFSEGGEKKDD